MPKLTHVRALTPYRVWLKYSDSAEGEVDLSDLAGRGVFELWEEPGKFSNVRVGPFGEASWGDEVELCPDALYLRLTGRTLEDVFTTSLARQRFNLILLGAFAIAALALSIVGLYGVIALSVGERRRELGVRIALGARPASVVALVLREAARIAAAGILIGLLAAALATKLIRGMLYDVAASDTVVYVMAAVVVAMVAMVSSWAPARSATRVDPAIALRAE